MTIFDRYLLAVFFRIFIICFISFAGLFVVIDVFSNLDEIGEIADQTGGFEKLFFEFYGPRFIDLFSRMAGILILISAIFSVTLMQRRRELTAIQAAGITNARVVRPVIFAAIFIIGVAAVSREIWIPRIKFNLVRTLKNWADGGVVPMNFQKDVTTGMLIRGQKLHMRENKITGVSIEMPVQWGREVSRIDANWGQIVAANEQHPEGLLLSQVTFPHNPRRMASVHVDDEIIVYAPGDFQWLKQKQVFVSCQLNAQEIAYGNQTSQYGSVVELIRSLKKPNRRFTVGDQVAVHTRILQPILDLTLLLLGLPFVMSKAGQNIFVAAAICLLIVVAVQLTTVAAHAMGAYRMIQPTVLAAWLPVLIFAPFTAVSLGKLFD